MREKQFLFNFYLHCQISISCACKITQIFVYKAMRLHYFKYDMIAIYHAVFQLLGILDFLV